MTDIVEEMRDAMKSAKALGPTDQQGVPTGEIVDYHMLAQAAYTIVERRIGERIEAAFREGWTDGYHNGRGGSVIDPEPDWLESEARASLEQRSDPKGSNP